MIKVVTDQQVQQAFEEKRTMAEGQLFLLEWYEIGSWNGWKKYFWSDNKVEADAIGVAYVTKFAKNGDSDRVRVTKVLV